LIDTVPQQGELRNFYGIEQNAFGPFRWAKPDASILIPMAAPGVYRVTLTLQDSPAAPAGRSVIVVAGTATETMHLTPTPQDYVIVARLEPLSWAQQPVPSLVVGIHSDPFTPPGDPRALGPIVSRVSITPVTHVAPDWFGLACCFLSVGLMLIALGHVGVRDYLLVAIGLVAATILAGLATLASTTLLRLSVTPTLFPIPFALGVCGALASVELSGMAARVIPDGHASVQAESYPIYHWRHVTLLFPLSLAVTLRFSNLDTLSLWLDEGATVHFAGLSWWRVLGLDGAYDLHPPLYYAMVKLAETVVSTASAGRLVSAVAGTLTVVTVYALVAMALEWRAALAASLLLALAPLHLWYSQEGRMYALGTFFVTLAALALIGFAQYRASGRVRYWWAALFAGAALAAAYSVYSAFYTLVPLGAPLLWVLWRARRHAWPLALATLAAVAGYLPWLPQVLATTWGIAANGSVLAGRTELLAATPDTIWGSLLSVSGSGGALRIYSNSHPFVLERWPFWQGAFVFLSLAVLLLGTVVLVRRAVLLAGIACCFLIGTVLVAIFASMLSPGYADRTILAAVIGWAIMGGAVVGVARPRWLLTVGLLGVATLLALSLDTVTILRTTASKQQYRDLVADAATVATIGYPVVPLGSWMPSFVETYAPTLRTTEIVGDRGMVVVPQRDGAPVGVLWLAYADNSWDNIGTIRQQLEARGYQRYLHKYYPRPLYLDLYALPTAQLGQPSPIDTSFAQWHITGSTIMHDVTSGTTSLHVPPGGPTGNGGSLDVPVDPRSLVTLEFTARLTQGQGTFTSSLTCLAASGSRLEQESNEAAANFPRDGKWHSVRVSTLCPQGTTTIRLNVGNDTTEALDFRDPVLSLIPLP
jgi:4-amino-4-deoxy-L-arabinose transferase-like glycosyltransferase